MTRDYVPKPVSTADALARRYCRCDQPMGQHGQCWKCGHPVKPVSVPVRRPKPRPGPVEVRVEPEWEQIARAVENGQR